MNEYISYDMLKRIKLIDSDYNILVNTLSLTSAYNKICSGKGRDNQIKLIIKYVNRNRNASWCIMPVSDALKCFYNINYISTNTFRNIDYEDKETKIETLERLDSKDLPIELKERVENEIARIYACYAISRKNLIDKLKSKSYSIRDMSYITHRELCHYGMLTEPFEDKYGMTLDEFKNSVRNIADLKDNELKLKYNLLTSIDSKKKSIEAKIKENNKEYNEYKKSFIMPLYSNDNVNSKIIKLYNDYMNTKKIALKEYRKAINDGVSETLAQEFYDEKLYPLEANLYNEDDDIIIDANIYLDKDYIKKMKSRNKVLRLLNR